MIINITNNSTPMETYGNIIKYVPNKELTELLRTLEVTIKDGEYKYGKLLGLRGMRGNYHSFYIDLDRTKESDNIDIETMRHTFKKRNNSLYLFLKRNQDKYQSKKIKKEEFEKVDYEGVFRNLSKTSKEDFRNLEGVLDRQKFVIIGFYKNKSGKYDNMLTEIVSEEFIKKFGENPNLNVFTVEDLREINCKLSEERMDIPLGNEEEEIEEVTKMGYIKPTSKGLRFLKPNEVREIKGLVEGTDKEGFLLRWKYDKMMNKEFQIRPIPTDRKMGRVEVNKEEVLEILENRLDEEGGIITREKVETPMEYEELKW